MYELSDIRWIIDRTAVIDTIISFANAMDAKDWQKLRSHLTAGNYFHSLIHKDGL